MVPGGSSCEVAENGLLGAKDEEVLGCSLKRTHFYLEARQVEEAIPSDDAEHAECATKD